jgi:hypothetical protein
LAKSTGYEAPQYAVSPFFLFGPNILLSTLFSNTLVQSYFTFIEAIFLSQLAVCGSTPIGR